MLWDAEKGTKAFLEIEMHKWKWEFIFGEYLKKHCGECNGKYSGISFTFHYSFNESLVCMALLQLGYKSHKKGHVVQICQVNFLAL